METEQSLRTLIREKLKNLSKDKLRKIAALAKIARKKKKAPQKEGHKD
jgi:hypothetical protein